MPDIVKQNLKEYSWIRYLKQRIRQNKNFLGVIVGPTGSGKSWSGLSIGEMVDPDFSVERVIFKGQDLMDLINNNKIKKGNVILWEEVGVSLSSRNWQSLANKMINFLLQTFRHKCFILLFTVPYEDFVDIQTRKLLHGEFKTVSIDFDKKTTRLKPKLYQYNPDMKKFYKKYLRTITKNGTVPVTSWSVPKPSDKLVNEYELKKGEFTKELNLNISQQLANAEEKEMVPKRGKRLTERQEEVAGLLSQYSVKEVSKKLGVSIQVLYQTKKAIEAKGAVFKPIWASGRIIHYEIEGLKVNNLQTASTNLTSNAEGPKKINVVA